MLLQNEKTLELEIWNSVFTNSLDVQLEGIFLKKSILNF